MYLTIDPGVSGSGWALWDFKWHLIRSGNFYAPKELHWEDKMYDIGKQLKDIVVSRQVTKIFIEFPRKFQGAGGDMVANRGDLVKLATFVGFLQGYLGVGCELIPVNQWKGQLPKDVVIRRIKKILPEIEIKAHAWDAVGIGLYKKGVF